MVAQITLVAIWLLIAKVFKHRLYENKIKEKMKNDRLCKRNSRNGL